MSKLIALLKLYLKPSYRTVACCCGHGKYPMTLVVEGNRRHLELFSGHFIARKKRFYRKDEDGFYYIPETLA